MEMIARYQRKAFLKDHPPVMARALLGSTGSEQTLLAGTVLGILANGKQAAYAVEAEGPLAGMTAHSILAEDVVVPAAGDQYALTYVHCDAVAPELTWADGVNATQQQAALAALRLKGIYAAEA